MTRSHAGPGELFYLLDAKLVPPPVRGILQGNRAKAKEPVRWRLQ